MAKWYIGIDLGGTFTKTCLMDDAGRSKDIIQRPTPTDLGGQAVIEAMGAGKLAAGKNPLTRIESAKKNGGPKAAVFVWIRSETYWNSLRTFWSACDASDRAVVDSCWRGCNASRLAPSWFESARVRSEEPVCSVLIVAAYVLGRPIPSSSPPTPT